MMKNVPVVVLSIVLFPLFTYSQSPGGVSSGSSVEMWFDANQLGLSDGQDVSSWTDFSGNSNHASQSNSSKRPTFNTNQVNGKPSVNFESTNRDYLVTGAEAGLDVNTQTTFIISEGSAASHTGFLLGNNYTTSVQYNGVYRQGNNLRSFTRNSSKSVKSVTVSNLAAYNILESNWDGASLSIYRNESVLGSVLGADGLPSGHSATFLGADPSNPGRYNFNGRIAEIIYYSSNLNSAERTIVLNYLSSKYSISISSDRYSYDATHGEDLIGIGQEADGSNTDASSVSTIQLNNMSTPGNGDYVMVGHDGAVLTPGNTADVPTVGWARYERVWRAGITGSPGNVDVVFDLSENSLGFPNSYVLLVDADGVFATGTTQYIGTYDAVTETVSFSNVTLADGEYIALANSDVNILSTNVTTDWNLTTTWNCGCIPTLGSQVEILNGHTVEINGSNANVGSLLINGTLNFTGASDSLFIDGDYTNNSTFSSGTGTMAFVSSSGVQVIEGIQSFHNLSVDNTSGVSISSGNSSITGFLNVISGSFNTNNAVTFSSNASGTGMLFNPTTGSVVGNITTERYLNEGDSWYLLGSSLTDGDLEDWNSEIEMQGFPGTEWPTASSSSVYYYDETMTGPSQDEGYQIPSNTTDVITNTRGYTIYVATDSYGAIPRTIDVTGAPKLGDGIVLSGTYTANIGDLADDGWNLVSNPYQSPVRYANVLKGGSYDVAYRKKANGSFQAINGVNIISPGEGFWLHCNGGPCTLTFDTEDIVDTVDVYNLKTSAFQNNEMVINLIYDEGQDDEAKIEFNLNSSEDYDIGFDQYKLNNMYSNKPNISVGESSDLYKASYQDDFEGEIPLRVYTEGPSIEIENYKLRFSNIDVVELDNKVITLEDRELGIFNRVVNNFEYSFSMYDTVSSARFFLHVESLLESNKTNSTCYNSDDGNLTITGYGNGPFDYFLFDNDNNLLESKIGVNGSTNFDNLEVGDYKVVVGNNDNYGDLSKLITISAPSEIRANFDIELEGQILDSYFEHSEDTIEIYQGQELSLINLSENATNFEWNFGDQSDISYLNSPNHTYLSSGIFSISLTAINGFCETPSEQYVRVTPLLSLNETNHLNDISVYYNENVIVSFNNRDREKYEIVIVNALGQQIFSKVINADVNHIENITLDKAEGIYIVSVSNGQTTKTEKIVLSKK